MFDKIDPKPKLTQTHTYKISGANGSSLGPLGTTICTLEFPMKFQQFIVCKHLLRPIILGLDFPHNYMIGTDWFSTKLLHLKQNLNPSKYQIPHLSHYT